MGLELEVNSISVTVAGPAVAGESVDLRISQAWLSGIDVNGIMPQPGEQIQAEDAVVLRVPAEAGAAVTVTISYRATGYGSLDGWVAAPGSARVAYRQFVYP